MVYTSATVLLTAATLATTIGPVTISADMYDEDDQLLLLLLVVLRLTVVITEVLL